jgi:hypothetical protein
MSGFGASGPGRRLARVTAGRVQASWVSRIRSAFDPSAEVFERREKYFQRRRWRQSRAHGAAGIGSNESAFGSGNRSKRKKVID